MARDGVGRGGAGARAIRGLIVEDNDGDARLIEELLASPDRAEIRFERAERLSTALRRLDEGGYDVVLADLNLPDSTGLETFLRLRAAAPKTPIVVLTGAGGGELAREAIRLGAQDYLPKGGLSGDILSRAIGYAIERQRAGDEVVRAEEARREHEEELAAIYDSAPLIMMLVDEDRRVRKINGFGAAFSGRSSAELIGLRGGEALRCLNALEDPAGCGFGPHCEGCIVRQTVVDTLETGRSHLQVEATLPFDIDGARRELTFLLSTTRVILGGRRLALLSVLDITERKRSEEALREREETLRSILRAAPIGIGLVRDRGIVWVSDRIGEMVGYESRELVGRDARILYPSDEEYERVGREKYADLERHGHGEILTQWRCRDGRTLDIDLRSAALDPEDLGRGVIFTATDITGRLELEARLRQSQRLESIGTLASGVAHEVNNPLMGMINYAELIADRAEDPTIRSFSEEIRREGERVAGIVRTLLQFAHREPETRRPVRPSEIVADALSLTGAALRADGVRVEVAVPERLPPVPCQGPQIEQVLINLLRNARDALNQRFPEGDERKVIRITAAEQAIDGRPWVRITVEDFGTGIDPAARDRIFDPFFTTKPRGVGTGLGLSISYGIVRDHGGRLWADVAPAGSTRFHVDLPLDA